jgi:hypothetical protein
MLAEREVAVGASAERLRQQVAALIDQLTTGETELADLAIIGKSLMNLTGDTETLAPVDATMASMPYQQIVIVRGHNVGECRPRRYPRSQCPGTRGRAGLGYDGRPLPWWRATVRRFVRRRLFAVDGVRCGAGLLRVGPRG